jgi:hypothetical protein
MIAIAILFVRMLCDCFKSRRRLEAEVIRRASYGNAASALCFFKRSLLLWLYGAP